MSNVTDSADVAETLNTVVGSVNLYTSKVVYQYFNYNVTPLAAIIFTGVFGLSTVVHFGQAIKSKHWFLTYTLFLGGLVESLGWASRFWAAQSAVWDSTGGGFWSSPRTAYLAQIITLIIGPAFLMAANYIVLGRLIQRVGQRYCRLGYKTYTALFVTGDVVSLLVQAFGGAMAASADVTADADKGARVMVIGVVWQMVVMLAYTFLLAEFTFRYLRDKPVNQLHLFAWTKSARAKIAEEKARGHSAIKEQLTWAEEKGAKWMLIGISGSTALIFIRSIYRTVELLDGWTGPLISNQLLFNLLDGVPIALSLVLLNVIHPMFFLKATSSPTMTKISSPMELDNDSMAKQPHYFTSSSSLNHQHEYQPQQYPRPMEQAPAMQQQQQHQRGREPVGSGYW